jgi:hypothetical protein
MGMVTILLPLPSICLTKTEVILNESSYNRRIQNILLEQKSTPYNFFPFSYIYNSYFSLSKKGKDIVIDQFTYFGFE